jgi:ribonuclease HII
VVAAAVVLKVSSLAVRIDDSKRLTSRQRARAFDAILDHADVGWGLADAGTIDRLNILQATFVAMQRAVRNLASPADLILIDGPLAPRLEVPCWPIVHGDQRSVAIACASIMAKVLRDRLMEFYDDLAPGYAFRLHKGYGTPAHAERLKALGPSVFHRRSFRPVRDTLVSWLEEPAHDPVADSAPHLVPI